jgi:multicomponent Na+:H+ antiporter subunit D
MPLLPPIPVAVLLGAALVVLAVSAFHVRRAIEAIAVVASIAAAVVSAILLVRSSSQTIHWFGGWHPQGNVAIGVDFAVDRIGAGLALLTGGLCVAVLVVSTKYFDEVDTLYYVLELIFQAAAIAFCFSGDLFNLFVFFELLSVSAYGLTAYKVEDDALQGALNFAVTNSIGAFFVLDGIALLYARTGTLSLAQIGNELAGHRADGLVVAAVGFVVVGFLVKAAAVPFHFWLADAHAVAPTPVCVLFSGMMVELGLFAVARVYWTAFSGVPDADRLRPVLIAFGVVTAVVGAVLCLAQHHLKRLLAYSTISHAGIMLTGIGLLDGKALAGTAVYVIAHGCVKGALFLATAALVYRFGAMDEARLHGRARRMYIVGPCWLLGGLALAGLPPFGMYLGKGLIDEALFAHHLGWLVVVLSAAAVATGAAVIRAGARVFLGWGEPQSDEAAQEAGKEKDADTAEDRSRSTPAMFVPIVALVLAAVAIGLLPGFARRTHDAAEQFVDRHAYAEAVMGAHPAPVPHSEVVGPTLVAGVTGTASALVAIVFGLAAVFAPSRDNVVRRWARAPIDGLQQLHTGRVGDLVAWLTLGIAVLGGGVALALH